MHLSYAFRLFTPMLAVALIVGCDAFDEGLLPDDSVDSACTDGNRLPPSRPEANDPGDDVPDFWIALKDVDLDQTEEDDQGRPEWSVTGFNLDGRCTTQTSMSFLCLPPSTVLPVDGEQGIDNAFGGALLELLELGVGPSFAGDTDELLNRGQSVIVARIRGWNGQPNDTSVEIVIGLSVFGVPGVAGEAPTVDIVNFEPRDPVSGEVLPTPNWDGGDFFWLNADGFTTPGASTIDEARPRILDLGAYVRDGQLTARLPDGADLTLGQIVIRMSGIVLTLNISDMYEGSRTEGYPVTAGGRWGYTDLLRTAEGAGVCPGSDLFPLLDRQLQGNLDLLLDPDNTSPGAACDALSVGVTFRAYFANFGGITEAQAEPSPCDLMADMGVPMPDMGAAPDMGVAPDMGPADVDMGVPGADMGL